jgi:hypothetical protein
MADGERESYGNNIGRLIDDYPDFNIYGETKTRPGYMAKERPWPGLPDDERVTLRDLHLDGLAAQMDVARAHRPAVTP